jgi:L-Ala-D/L-Glu epimerase / N-acetyl-D-glutamate racemase
MIELQVRHETWPLATPFTISRGSRTTAEVVVVQVRGGGVTGRGECVPYPRYDETVEGVIATVEALAPRLAEGMTRDQLQEALPAGSARNGLDCALWDWQARRERTTVAQLLGMSPLQPLITAYTLSLDTPERMGRAARENASRPVLKSKLAGEGDLERMAAVHENAPAATLIVDANEAWSSAEVEPYCAALVQLGVALVEQPLPAAEDAALADISHPLPLCADESCHTRADLDRLAGRYDVINIKLEKAGGLTEAMALHRAARERGLQVMVGCMIGTSLAMAPAVLVAQGADFVDLDGPLLIGRDRDPGLRYEGSLLHPPGPDLWG